MKTNCCSKLINLSLVIAFPLFGQTPPPAQPRLTPAKSDVQPSKAFLLYLAELEQIDSEWVSPLDLESELVQTHKHGDKVDNKCDRSKDECKK
jgi:hypothetical protein